MWDSDISQKCFISSLGKFLYTRGYTRGIVSFQNDKKKCLTKSLEYHGSIIVYNLQIFLENQMIALSK